MSPPSGQRASSISGRRRLVDRVRADLMIVISLANGDKVQARVVDVSVGGMCVSCVCKPSYGEAITVIVRLDEKSDWVLLPATVRWFTTVGFGLEFRKLSEAQATALAAFVAQAAA